MQHENKNRKKYDLVSRKPSKTNILEALILSIDRFVAQKLECFILK